MVLSGIYILDMKGKVLIARNYRGDIENTVIDKFIGLVMDKEDEGQLTPLLQTQEATFAYIKHNNLYVVVRGCCCCLVHLQATPNSKIDLLSGHDEKKLQHRHDLLTAAQDLLGLRGLLQGRGGGEHPRQHGEEGVRDVDAL
jgi:hypothetical protein